MTAPFTPEEWLPILTKGLDDERAARLAELKRHMDSDAPLPEMGRNLRASWQRFQKESRTNWGALIVGSVADRIVPIGVEVAGSTESSEAAHAQRIWRDNRLDVIIKDLVREGVAYRDAYLCVTRDDAGRAIITTESPLSTWADMEPARKWKARAAIKTWRDTVAGRDYAYVWAPGGGQRFSRPARKGHSVRLRVSSTDWVPDAEVDISAGGIPIHVFQNPTGSGEFELHLDLINRINRGVLGRLVIAAMQAFRQRALKRKSTPDTGLDDQDGDDNDQDWSVVFEPAPGALWDLPPDVDLWESQVTDMTPILAASKSDLRDLAAVTRTPLPMLVPDGQSATGAAEMASGLVFKSRDVLKVVEVVVAAAILDAMRFEGAEPSGTIKILSENPERVTLSEKYSAAAQAKAAGESWRSIQRNILGRTPDQIRQDAADRAAEQLASATLLGTVDGRG